MEKRLVLAVIVSIVFFFLWSWLFNPAVPPQLPEEAIDEGAGAPPIESLPESTTGPQPTAQLP